MKTILYCNILKFYETIQSYNTKHFKLYSWCNYNLTKQFPGFLWTKMELKAVHYNLKGAFEDTKNIINAMPIPKTHKYKNMKLFQDNFETNVYVVLDNTLSAAELFKNEKTLILNFANNDVFCDDRFGGQTQEEDIARRTNLSSSLMNFTNKDEYDKHNKNEHNKNSKLYPISDDWNLVECASFLLSENVCVIKNKYNVLLEETFYIDVISSAAIKCPRMHIHNLYVSPRKHDGQFDASDSKPYAQIGRQSFTSDGYEDKHDYYRDADREVMKRKIENIVKTATYYDVFIAGAWGMGVYGNPYFGLINIWNEVLKQYKVPIVIFAIPDRKTYINFKKYLDHRKYNRDKI